MTWIIDAAKIKITCTVKTEHKNMYIKHKDRR